MITSPLDVWFIFYDPRSRTYHPCFAVEAPMPGPRASFLELEFVRLRSKMHHTCGLASYEEALRELDKCVAKCTVPDGNVVREPVLGDAVDYTFTLIAPNWTWRSDRQITAADLGRPVVDPANPPMMP